MNQNGGFFFGEPKIGEFSSIFSGFSWKKNGGWYPLASPRFGLCWPLRHVVMRPWWVRWGSWGRLGEDGGKVGWVVILIISYLLLAVEWDVVSFFWEGRITLKVLIFCMFFFEKMRRSDVLVASCTWHTLGNNARCYEMWAVTRRLHPGSRNWIHEELTRRVAQLKRSSCHVFCR